jgi:hypothetical protein
MATKVARLSARTTLTNYMDLAEHAESFRFLIRDRDQKFTASCDEVFRSYPMEIIRTPFALCAAKLRCLLRLSYLSARVI